MPPREKYSYKEEELVGFLQPIARYLTDSPTHTLISANDAKAIAFQQDTTPEDVPYSYPWYIHHAKCFLGQGVELPPITQVKLLRMGEAVRFAEHGLYRKSSTGGEDAIVPIIFEPSAIGLIQATPEYLLLKGDAMRLATLMNQDYYAPGRGRLRFLIQKFDAFCLARRTNRPMEPVQDVMHQPMPQMEPPEGWSNTRTVELYRASLDQNAGILELIRAAIANNDTIGAREDQAIAANSEAVAGNNRAIDGNNRAIDGNNQAIASAARARIENENNTAFLREAYRANAADHARIFGNGVGFQKVVPALPPAVQQMVPALPPAAQQMVPALPAAAAAVANNGRAAALAAAPLVEGMGNLNIGGGHRGENIGPAPGTPERAPREIRPVSTRPKSTRKKARPDRFE